MKLKKAKNLECCRTQICKPPRQLSGLCSTLFPSYLSKRCTQLYRVLCGDAMLVDESGPPIHLYHSVAILESVGNKGFAFGLPLPV